MTTNHHTPITSGAAANASTINSPLSQLDTKITSLDGKMTGLDIGMVGLQLIWNSATSISVDVGSCHAENGDSIVVTSTLVKSSLSLSASTWYHVYVYLSGGSPAAEVVTTAPAVWKGTAYRKTGDTSRRYVGSVKSDGGGNVLEFRHHNLSNTIYYAQGNSVLTLGTATTLTSIDCSGFVPVTSIFSLFYVVTTATTTCDLLYTTSVVYAQLGAGNTQVSKMMLEMPMTAAQLIYYKFTSAPTGGLYVNVLGYRYSR
jgi:hypothetical protein